MIDYDFSTLNDKEFENLSIELISKDKNKKYERFKAGKDGGIDGRFYREDGTQEIIQCKHYLKTGFSGLIASLKKKNDKGIDEIEKVKKLNPLKYIFVTSVALSAENKKTIKRLFDPYIKNDNDIYGQEDLNVILGKNPDIEKRHYKLWLSSTVVLERLLNNAIESRSEFLLEDIKEKSKYYVVTNNDNQAIKKLEESHIVIIAGEPGIGKTTLAEHMVLRYIERDFKLYNIENSINEAESVYKRDEKQIFYFDDFLGSNYLNAIEYKKDSHIVKFMDRIKRDKTKRFILTSRTNIFNQGLALSDTFKSKNIAKEEFIIKIESLKEIDKATILYNHIWHSDLDEEFIEEIYIDKRYKKIINHKNFNPRLIVFITDIQKIQKEKIETKDYWSYISEKLDNPQDIWKATFDYESDDYIRNLVILSVFNGNKIGENELAKAYASMNKCMQLNNPSHGSKDFESVIQSVVKYFLNRNIIRDNTIEYSLFNPSIADFIINRYKNNKEKLLYVFLSLETLESLKVLKILHFNGIISNEIFQEIIIKLYEKLNITRLKNKNSLDYAIMLFHFLEIYYQHTFEKNKMITFCKNMTMELEPFALYEDFLFLLTQLQLREELQVSDFRFLIHIIETMNTEVESINKVIEYINEFKIDNQDVVFALNNLIDNYLAETLDGAIHDIGINDVEFANDENGYPYIINGLNDHINDYLEDFIGEIDKFNGIQIDKVSISQEIDTLYLEEKLVVAYLDSFEENQNIERHKMIYTDDIDDLFER